MSRNALLRMALPASLLLSLAACGDTGTGTAPGDAIAEIAGSWASTRIELASRADPSRRVDLADLGADLLLSIGSDGRFSGALDIPDIATGERERQDLSGTMAVGGGGTLLVDFDEPVRLGADTAAVWAVDYTEAGTTMTWTDPDAAYDFDLGLPNPAEPATLTIAFTRTG